MKLKQQDVVRSTLMKIAKQNNNLLSPESVLENAKDESSPIHEWFMWDDGEAAHEYRIMQARMLIQKIKIIVVVPEKQDMQIKVEVRQARQFESLPAERGAKNEAGESKGSYAPIEVILEDKGKRADLLSSVLKELLAYRKKYALVEELSAVWEAIEEARKKAEA